jgi:hypothetical protein
MRRNANTMQRYPTLTQCSNAFSQHYAPLAMPPQCYNAMAMPTQRYKPMRCDGMRIRCNAIRRQRNATEGMRYRFSMIPKQLEGATKRSVRHDRECCYAMRCDAMRPNATQRNAMEGDTKRDFLMMIMCPEKSSPTHSPHLSFLSKCAYGTSLNASSFSPEK